MTDTGRIILLKGTSSSGKTTIARALQKTLDEPYLHVSVDAFLDQLPDPLPGDDFAERLPQFVHAFQASAAAQARAGMHVILDHVLKDPVWLEDCVVQFSGIDVLFVAVRCQLAELERREALRGDRRIGTAKSQFDRVHAHDTYDLELDTSVLDPEQCVAAIAQRLHSCEPAAAFSALRRPVRLP